MICFVSQGVEQDAKNALKNIMIFLTSGSQYNYYYMRANYKSRYLKTTLGTFFRKPYKLEVSNLVVMLLLGVSTN